MEYDADLSGVSCGCISAIYSILMPAADNNSDPFKYCDANKVGGYWCPEFDLMEANRHAFKAIGHKCDDPDTTGVYSNCDRGGKCTLDVLVGLARYAYGAGSDFNIDTTLPFHVKTEFLESQGVFTGYTITLS